MDGWVHMAVPIHTSLLFKSFCFDLKLFRVISNLCFKFTYFEAPIFLNIKTISDGDTPLSALLSSRRPNTLL